MSDISEFSLPTNPDDIARIEGIINDICAQMQMMADRKESIKENKQALKESFDMPTSLVNKLVKARFEDKYEEMTAENSVFELVFETLYGDDSEDED